jgi:phosphate transport system substrate-binding protein
VFNRVTTQAAEAGSRRTARRWIVVTLVLTGGLVAAACGSSSPSTSAAKKTNNHKSSATTTTSTTAAASATTTTAAAGATTTTAAKTTTGTAAPTAKSVTTTTKAAAAPSTGLGTALGGSADLSTPAAALSGAGSTFDQPLFARQFYDYNKANPKVTVTYASVGSGAGETDILGGSVSFGASDVPEPSTTTGSGGSILQIPVVLGGVAMAYNEPCLGTSAHLTGTQIAQIYKGTITDWHTISANCPTGSNIEPVYRADSSGTSNAFTHYLNSVDPTDWPSTLVGKQPAFPKGEGGNGNPGVAGDVQGGAGTIGYVELAYALQGNLQYAAVQNSAGAFVIPSLSTVAADAAQFPNVTADSPYIVNGPGAGSYPISTYSWIIVYAKQANQNNGIALGHMLDWMVTTGQSDSSAIGYVPLPSNIVSLAKATILKMTNSSGQALFS